MLAFDAPAHGSSSGETINALIYRDFIISICQAYGPVHSFVAHSFGGLATAMALAELPHDEGYRLVLIAPVTETSTAVDQFFRFVRVNDSSVRREFVEIISQIGGNPLSWYSIGRTLGAIRAKILWIHDKDDEVTPYTDVLKVREENHPGLEFVITEGLGHSRIYRDAKVGKAIVRFA